MTFLLDVNVLIALIDPTHVTHDAAHAWFESAGYESWATCPLTENGVIRIVGNSKYPNSPGTPDTVAAIVRTLRGLPGHVFWADDISLADPRHVDTSRLAQSAQVTDTYLLALAKAHRGQLATFDRRLSPAGVQDGKQALYIISHP